MAIIQVNFTPIPSGWDKKTNQCRVLLHVSFIGVEKDAPVKLSFSQYETLRKFIDGKMYGQLKLNFTDAAGKKTFITEIGPPNADSRLWDLFPYAAHETLRTFFQDRADVDKAVKDVQAKQAALEKERDMLKGKIAANDHRRVGIDFNLDVLKGLDEDLAKAIAGLNKETDHIAGGGAYQQYLQEYTTKRLEYSKEKTALQTIADDIFKALAVDNGRLTEIQNALEMAQ